MTINGDEKVVNNSMKVCPSSYFESVLIASQRFVTLFWNVTSNLHDTKAQNDQVYNLSSQCDIFMVDPSKAPDITLKGQHRTSVCHVDRRWGKR